MWGGLSTCDLEGEGHWGGNQTGRKDPCRSQWKGSKFSWKEWQYLVENWSYSCWADETSGVELFCAKWDWWGTSEVTGGCDGAGEYSY